MKLPAIRAKIGTWTYYVTTLTFDQVNEYVSPVDEELHKSESLKDLIQRSITNNYKSIEQYIHKQRDLFFNSLVLAVYNDYPDWRELEVKYDDFVTHRIGVLEFPGEHKIFPLDGQHRVEGIKAALKSDPSLGEQMISVIFVGHKNSSEGMQKSRRLFSTLNRYAKPVTMDDIIALDEDDCIAIVTRALLEDFHLFGGRRVTKSKNKAINENDNLSITSIITLYQCNKELLKQFRKTMSRDNSGTLRNSKSLAEYLKFRPNPEEIEDYLAYCFDFWRSLEKGIEAISEFSELDSQNPVHSFRNRNDGGHLLFRPVGLLPFVQASIEIHKRRHLSYDEVFQRLNHLNFTLNSPPWKYVVWSPIDKTMIMGSTITVKLLLFYMYGQEVIRNHELELLKTKYSAKLNIEDEHIDPLHDVPKLD